MKTTTPLPRLLIACCLLTICCLVTPVRAADPEWQSVADDTFKRLGVWEMKPSFKKRCVGMAVAPTGDVFIVTSAEAGVIVSRDHGQTWSVAEGNGVTGRSETGWGAPIAYPYDGRLAFFTIDGTGGITLDGGKTWRAFGRILRMFDYADADWSVADPQTVFGLTHEPYFTTLSTDGGRTWTQLYKDAETPKDVWNATKRTCFGVVNAGTIVRGHLDHPGIELSTDAGATWTKVSDRQVTGRRPVHYGKRLYWTTPDGVIASDDGRDWSLVGTKLEGAAYGPHFGNSENEMMVVTEQGFHITRDAGKTWKCVAPLYIAPDGITNKWQPSGSFLYYGWDATGNYLYASQLGGSVCRMKVAE
ncbi:MAG: hypothetical protein GC159_10115 [Phycisphaera sp.]|nr:hypothetical protein [Phycisphaera sp.]